AVDEFLVEVVRYIELELGGKVKPTPARQVLADRFGGDAAVVQLMLPAAGYLRDAVPRDVSHLGSAAMLSLVPVLLEASARDIADSVLASHMRETHSDAQLEDAV